MKDGSGLDLESWAASLAGEEELRSGEVVGIFGGGVFGFLVVGLCG